MVPAGVGLAGGLNREAVAMNATERLLRWLGIGATRGLGIQSTAPCGRIRGLLPVLMLGGLTLAAQAQYQFRTEVNPDGTLTVHKALPGREGQGCSPEGR